MRLSVCFFTFMLAGCAEPNFYTSLCDIRDFRGAIGAQVTFSAMLMAGNEEYPPSVVDRRCWHSLPADMQDAPKGLQHAFERAGKFNKFAIVTGRIKLFNGEPWLRISDATQVSLKPPMSAAQEDAFFSQVVKERNAWDAAHPGTHQGR